MKLLQKISVSIVAVSVFALSAQNAFAITQDLAGNNAPIVNDNIIPPTNNAPLLSGKVDVHSLIQWGVIILVAVGILAALIWLILGAIKWIISGGDKEKVAAARGQIIAAIIGLLVLLLAVVILNFAVSLIQPGQNIFNFNIPSLSDSLKAN